MDYRKYRFTMKEVILCLLQAVMLIVVLTYLFYRSIWGAVPLSVLVPIWFHQQKILKSQKKQEERNVQFGDFLQSLSGALSAGHSLEQSFSQAGEEMERLHGRENYLVKEMNRLRKLRSLSSPLEEIFTDFAKRSGVEEAETFSNVLNHAVRTGGNLVKIIRETQQRMQHRMEARREVEKAIWAKKTEQKIMSFMPMGILGYVNMTNPGYLGTIYHNLPGILVMTGCLGVYFGAVALGEKMIRINW